MTESAFTARITTGASHAHALSHAMRRPATRSPHSFSSSSTDARALSTARPRRHLRAGIAFCYMLDAVNDDLVEPQ